MFNNDKIWITPEKYMAHLLNKTHFLDSFKLLEPVIRAWPNEKILDLGSGYGWTSVLISKWANRSEILSTDKDEDLINSDLSTVAKSINHEEIFKIKREVADFESVGNNYTGKFDIAVAASSIHHSANLIEDFKSIKNTLKPRGILIIANEFDISRFDITYVQFLKSIRMAYQNLFTNYSSNEQLIGQGRVRYDSKLGDWFICNHYYDYVARIAGFENKQYLKTKIKPYLKGQPGNIYYLRHIIYW